jgi:hypothetical protein
MRILLTTIAALALTGCSVLGLADDEGVRIRLESAGLVVENDRSSEIFYAAIGENSLMLWAACVRPDCPRIGSRQTDVIPLDAIHAADSPAILFHWWERRRSGDSDVPGEIHTVRVPR